MNLLSALQSRLPRSSQRPSPQLSAIGDGIEDAIQSLRSCKNSLQQRQASLNLHTTQVNIAGLALELDLHMDGDSRNAARLLNRVQRQNEAPLRTTRKWLLNAREAEATSLDKGLGDF